MKNFENHLRGKHNNYENPIIQSIKCGVANCGINIVGMNELYKHYFKHLREKEENMVCFFKNCGYQIKTSSAFSCHLSNYHTKSKLSIQNLKDELILNYESPDENEEMNVDSYSDYNDPLIEKENLSNKISSNYKNLEQFYMKLYL